MNKPLSLLPLSLCVLLLLGSVHEARSQVWQPLPGTTWQIQFSKLPVDTGVEAEVFDVDGFDNDAEVVADLHTRGRRVIGYVSAGTYEEWRDDAAQYPAAVLGKPLDEWPGERWLDVRRLDVLAPLVNARLDVLKSKGFDAVDFDNVDAYANDSGFPLTAADQLAFNRFLADAAHARGMAVGLKNDLEQVPDLVGVFDFAINEQCFFYKESKRLKPFVAANKAVFVIEYDLPLNQFADQARKLRYSAIKKHLSLDRWRKARP